jgi:hypothetical protein
MDRAICLVVLWPAAQLKAALAWRLLHRSLRSLRACLRIWVPKARQVSTQHLGLLSTSVDTSLVQQ